jgi:hypothetical protein
VSRGGHAFDQRYLDLANACEIEFGLRCGAGVLEDDFVLAVAGNFAGERVKPFGDCRARGKA